VVEQLAAVRLKLAEPKSRLLDTGEGVPFCGFRYLPGLRPRVLGATKRRFEGRRYRLFAQGDLPRLGAGVFAWYQFSREGNAAGLRRVYSRWPLAARLKRRQRRIPRGLRGGSWNNNATNLRSAYRNNNTPDNRNNNIGFRCVWAGGSAPKAAPTARCQAGPACLAGAKKPA
jgi:hypothetical protein